MPAAPSGDYRVTYTDKGGNTWVKTGTFGTGSQIDFNDLFIATPAGTSNIWPFKEVKLEVRTTSGAPNVNFRATGGFMSG
jgi:hypothetical protein